MNILGILPISIGGRLTTSSILDGFRQLGHTVAVYDELKDNYSLENNYDLIVGYDFSPVKLKRDYNLSMKCVAYFSDEIRNRTSGPYWKELLEDLDRDDVYTFYWDRELVKQENFKNLFYLPHFVNTEIYKNEEIQKECDVMFAGRLDTDYRLDMITSLAEALGVSFKWYAIERHYQDALSRAKNKQLIEKIYSGFIDNERDMADAINKSKIVINMNSQGVSSLNYRTMQTVACKRMLISDKRQELDLFDNKIPTYENKEVLKEKILFYLNNEQEYNRITEYCEMICREKYSSRQGVKYILDKIKA